MVEVSTYRVDVVREGDDWVAHWDGRSTFASSLRALDKAVREVIVLAEGLPDEAAASLTLDLTYGLDESIMDGVAWAATRRAAADEAADKAARATAVAVWDLRHGAGLSQRDVGVILGLSHQRVAQIEAARRIQLGIDWADLDD